MAKILEVIVASEDEAVEAEDGGADRLELVRALGVGGLTPDIGLVHRVLRRVAIPVRVMLRESPTLNVGREGELEKLGRCAAEIANMPVDGLVLGFANQGKLDVSATVALLACAPAAKATFHRAFEEAADPLAAIEQLKSLPQIDRILTSGGPGNWCEQRTRLIAWQAAAGPIKLLVGAGLCKDALAGLRLEPSLEEVHVGRAARMPPTIEGKVCRQRVAAVKSALE